MKTISEIRQHNFQKIADSFISHRVLADALDTTPGYVSQLLTGHRGIGEKTARKIEVKLNLNHLMLDEITFINKDAQESNVEYAPELQAKVPLINWIQAGKWQEISENDDIKTLKTWLLTTAKVSKQAFALRVVGDSMTNPHGSPSIPDGYIIIVDPAIQPINGSIVVAVLDDSKEATLKKLVIDGSKCYLKPLNPAYQAIEITDNCTICGVVKKVEYDL